MDITHVMKEKYSSLRQLSNNTGISVRTLRAHLKDPIHPLPHFRVKGLILIKDEEFEVWLDHFRVKKEDDIRRITGNIFKKKGQLTSGNNSSPVLKIHKGWELSGDIPGGHGA